jgi:hypothetical protein
VRWSLSQRPRTVILAGIATLGEEVNSAWPLVLPIFNGVLAWAIGGRGDLLPEGCQHSAAQGFEWGEVVDRLRAAPVALILAEAGSLPMVSHPFWGAFEGLLVVVDKARGRGRVEPQAWTRAGQPVSHAHLGGVTDFRTGCTWLQRGNAERVFQLGDPVGVDAPSSTVVDPRCGFRGGVPAGALAPGDFDPRTDKLKWSWL